MGKKTEPFVYTIVNELNSERKENVIPLKKVNKQKEENIPDLKDQPQPYKDCQGRQDSAE